MTSSVITYSWSNQPTTKFNFLNVRRRIMKNYPTVQGQTVPYVGVFEKTDRNCTSMWKFVLNGLHLRTHCCSTDTQILEDKENTNTKEVGYHIGPRTVPSNPWAGIS